MADLMNMFRSKRHRTRTRSCVTQRNALRHVRFWSVALLGLVVLVGCKREAGGAGERGGSPRTEPHVHDAELATLLTQGAPNCVVYVGGVFESCPEATKVTSYVAALPIRRKADAGGTCAAFLSARGSNTALLAATCMEGLDPDILTHHLPSAMDALRQKPAGDVRQAIARAFRRADARAAGIQDEVLAYVRSTDEEPHLASTASAVAFLVETLFVDAESATHGTSPAAQAWALEALATGKNQQFAALEQWSHVVDKRAACDALVKSMHHSAIWVDTMTIVMGGHDCDARLVDFFAALVERVPRDPMSVIATVLTDIDVRVEVPAALRTLAATRLRERHERDARTMRDSPLTQEWLQTFAAGAAHFAAPRPSRP